MHGNQVQKYFIHLILIVVTALTLLPFIWMISTSVKTPDQVFEGGLWFFPSSINLDGFKQVFEQATVLTWALNSTFIAVIQTISQVIIAFLAAYAFARFDFPGRNILFYFVLATMIIPQQALMIPTFITINMMDWIDTFKGVIIPHMASGYAIFLLRQFMMGIPKELAEAAAVDGCGHLRILRHIYLPASVPALTALSIILFVSHWNDFYWPLLVLSDENKLTLPVALVRFQNEGMIEMVPTMAVATLSTLPILILYFFSQKKFVEGFTNSGLKG
ncbi:TPA: carbohydrate ABC transporter permease [Bacillus paranthracis]